MKAVEMKCVLHFPAPHAQNTLHFLAYTALSVHTGFTSFCQGGIQNLVYLHVVIRGLMTYHSGV
jgi:hypothetical protein